MRAKNFLAAAVCAIPLGAFAQPPSTSTAREIARLDSEYSNLSVAKGMTAASVEYFAEDGIAFASTAVTRKNIWACRSDFPGTLPFPPVSGSVPFCLALEAGLWQKRKHDACLPRAAACTASGLYRFYLALIADLLFRLLVRRLRIVGGPKGERK